MTDPIPPIADEPKEALRLYIEELETYYYSWYDGAATRNYYFWSAAQALALLSGFATALLAALMKEESFKTWTPGRVLLVVLPVVGSLASTFLIQSRIRDLMGLRERGRESIQRLTSEARVSFAAVTSSEQYSEIHRNLVAEVGALEREQSRSFFTIAPERVSVGPQTKSLRRSAGA
jgi:hypothetical protein